MKNVKKKIKKCKNCKILKCSKFQFEVIFSTRYHRFHASRMLKYVYISEKVISEKSDIFHVFVDFGTLSTPLLNYFGEFEAQKQKRKIPYVKPFPAFDWNRKSNVKLWINLKKVFFTKFVIETDLAAKLPASPVLLF